MSPIILFSFVIGYFVLLLVVAWFTSRNANNDSFLLATATVTGCWWHLV